MEGFFSGFVMLAETCKKEGIDIPIYVSYFKKEEKLFVVDKVVKYSQLCVNGDSREEISRKLCERCNELGKMKF